MPIGRSIISLWSVEPQLGEKIIPLLKCFPDDETIRDCSEKTRN